MTEWGVKENEATLCFGFIAHYCRYQGQADTKVNLGDLDLRNAKARLQSTKERTQHTWTSCLAF